MVPGDRGMSKVKRARQKESIEVGDQVLDALEKLT